MEKKAPNISVILRSVQNEKKSIHILKDNLGSIISDQKDILKELYSFYQTLYRPTSKSTPHNKEDTRSFLDSLDIPQISDDSKLKLNSPVSKAEILSALKSLNLNRSLGYDGLPVEFYIFHDICDLLLNCYHLSFEQGFLSVSQHSGVITLLPKKDQDPLYVKNHHPILLLNTDYKIIAKVMANQLKS